MSKLHLGRWKNDQRHDTSGNAVGQISQRGASCKHIMHRIVGQRVNWHNVCRDWKCWHQLVLEVVPRAASEQTAHTTRQSDYVLPMRAIHRS